MTEKPNDDSNTYVENKVPYIVLIFIAGIIFPAMTLIFEIIWEVCAENFLDPIPTLFHVLLVGFVPIANAHLLWAIYKQKYERTTLLGWTSGIALGITIFYSFIFLPVSPISFIGILFLGVGFFGFSPMFAYWATYKLRKYYRNATATKNIGFNWRATIVGLIIAVSVVGISESRYLITNHGLQLMTSKSVEDQNRGVKLIRNFGDENYLLRLSKSYRKSFYVSDTFYQLIKPSNIQTNGIESEAYYRLNGINTDNMGTPTRFGFSNEEVERWQNRDISLITSVMEGSIDNDASLGYLEWTFEFQNNAEIGQGEAIGQIQLPKDSVVSRLTLWVNGEEREAAFAERTKVTEAYQKVVSSKRDPVLVTTSGKDRVDMKCFPIMPNAGKMKVRIGITFPLVLDDNKSGLLNLPYFRERNFVIIENFQHKISLLATNELQANSDALNIAREDRFYVMRGILTESNLVTSAIRAERSEEKTSVWAKYDNTFIKQEIIENISTKPSRYIFVLDTSKSMRSEKQNILFAIQDLPENKEISLILTNGNGLNTEMAYPHIINGKPQGIAAKIVQTEFGGGTDNLPALIKAWELAKEDKNGVVIWIHSPQTFQFITSKDLAKKLVRSSNQTEIYNLPIGYGKDLVENELTDLNFLRNVSRFGDIKTYLNRLISQLDNTTKGLKYARTIDTKAKETVDKKTSKHMIRLWAFDEINEVLASEKDEVSAIELATKYQLVTPVTGAVVLETQEQYDEAGLNPVEKNVVHAVPETETYILMIIGLVIFLFVYKKQILSF